MDAMVSGRIPIEMKERGSALLSEIGATQTELIKSAYEYLIAEGKLPTPSATLAGPAALTKRDINALEQFINETTLAVDPSFWDGFDLKEALAEGRRADYEALA